MSYNGWRNWETWQIALYLDNEIDVNELVGGDNSTIDRLAAHLQESVYDYVMADVQGGLVEEFVRGALSEVDWDELAEAQIESVREDEEDYNVC